MFLLSVLSSCFGRLKEVETEQIWLIRAVHIYIYFFFIFNFCLQVHLKYQWSSLHHSQTEMIRDPAEINLQPITSIFVIPRMDMQSSRCYTQLKLHRTCWTLHFFLMVILLSYFVNMTGNKMFCMQMYKCEKVAEVLNKTFFNLD